MSAFTGLGSVWAATFRQASISFSEANLPDLKCQVVWCLPRDGSRHFDAGLRIYHTDLEVVRALEAIVE